MQLIHVLIIGLFLCLSDKGGITFVTLFLYLFSFFFFLALTSGPWDVLSISWWLVYHRSELGKYQGDVVVTPR